MGKIILDTLFMQNFGFHGAGEGLQRFFAVFCRGFSVGTKRFIGHISAVSR